MPFIIDYLLKVSIALAVVYLFYQLVLRRLTFYNWNRLYLVGYSLLCFFIPFMNITDFLFRHELQQNNFIQIIPSYQQIRFVKQEEAFWNAGTIMLAVFTAGVLMMGIRVLLQLISLRKIKNKATLLNSGDVKLYHINESIVPFSFHDSIYVNKEQHTEAELREIIRHEFVHVKQKHSVDILLAELLCIVLWFNPVAWLLRKAIRQNLEFIADHKVLEEGLDKKQYQYLLLKVVGNSQFSITPKFNFSSLKNRIAMMNKMKSARVQIIRFLFVLPLIAVLLLAFREVKLKERKHEFLQPTALLTDTVPADNISSVNVTKNNGENSIRIVLKDGTVENYNLNNAEQKAAFEKKYGELKPPPPPPATPSNSGTMINSKEIETVDVIKKDGKNTISIRLKNGKVETYDLNDPKQKEALEKKYGTTVTTPPPPPPPVESLAVISPSKEQLTPNKKGYYLTIADNNGECVVIVKDKKKKIVEALTLTDWNKKETFYTNKYGDIPPPPPPVAPLSSVSVVAPVSIATTVSPVSKITGTVAPTVSVTSVKSNVSVISEVNALSPVTATVQVAPAAVESKLTIATSPVVAVQTTVPSKLQVNVSGVNGFPTGALYYIDGKEVNYEDVEKLSPDSIESISILKGNDATKGYGEKGKNGVILIKTKIKTAKRNMQIYDKVNVEPDK